MLKILIDTNVFVSLEDAGPIHPVAEEFARLAASSKSRLYVHNATLDDIARDKDIRRRVASVSRSQKYEFIAKSWRLRVDLEAAFGRVKNDNDEVDCHILSATQDDLVDIVVTNDADFRRRATLVGLGDRVLSIHQAIEFLRSKFTSDSTELTSVCSVKCHQIDLSDPLFESLKADYNGFETWFREKCVKSQRDAWIINIGGNLAGICIFKDEGGQPHEQSIPGDKILKLNTFKISEEYQGGRLGDLLLRQAIWYCDTNKYTTLYLTAYSKQQHLIQRLETYGFQKRKMLQGDELIFFKSFDKDHPKSANLDAYEYACLNYPRFRDTSVAGYLVPIKPNWHQRLFPEATQVKRNTTLSLFDPKSGTPVFGSAAAIRKAYLCKSVTTDIASGSIVFFYMTKNQSYAGSQCLTAVGVVESFKNYSNAELLIRDTANRTVYSQEEIETMFLRGSGVKLLNFILIGYCQEVLALGDMISSNLINGQPQSITAISELHFSQLVAAAKISARVPNY
jgi:predicted nucleic acid-binding protein/GNAT superfamily N-acetyltransferase